MKNMYTTVKTKSRASVTMLSMSTQVSYSNLECSKPPSTLRFKKRNNLECLASEIHISISFPDPVVYDIA